MYRPMSTTTAVYGYIIDRKTGRKILPFVQMFSWEWSQLTRTSPRNPAMTHANPGQRRRQCAAAYQIPIA
jgi:hypothetical protein